MKKAAYLIALLLALTVFGARAEEGAIVAELADGYALVGQTGALLTERGAYAHIERLADNRFAARSAETGLYGLLDGTGAALSDFVYSGLYRAGEILIAEEGELLGAFDFDMRRLAPSLYTQLVPSGTGGFLALNTDPYDERPDGVYLVNAAGEERATGARIHFGLTEFCDGLMAAVAADNGQMGFLGPEGDWAVAPQYAYAGDFAGGHAEACLDTGAGLIDRQGNWLLTPKYQSVTVGGANGGIVLVQESSADITLLDPLTLAPVKRFEGQDIYCSAYTDADLAVLYLDDCTQIIDAAGNEVARFGVEASFDAWSEMGDRLIVQVEWGEKNVWLYDLQGGRVAGPYQEMWLLGERAGRAFFGVSDFAVEELVDADVVWRAYTEVEGTRQIGVIDQDGQIVLPLARCDSLTYDEAGAFLFTLDGQLTVRSLQGETIFQDPPTP